MNPITRNILRSVVVAGALAAVTFIGSSGIASAGSVVSAGLPPAGSTGLDRVSVFSLTGRRVLPRRSVPDSVKPLRVFFRFRGPRPVQATVRLVRLTDRKVVRRIPVAGARPGRWHRVLWDGRSRRGKLTRPGRYVALAGPAGGPFRRVARFRLHGHRFPIAGPHGIRGAVGEFGAGRTGGRIHEGFDATGRCGTPLVAVRAGRVLRVGSDPVLYGNYVIYSGEGEHRTYFYAHMRRPSGVHRGQRVRAGRRLGVIGRTGNAASTPCHLHIEIRSRGRLLDPGPILRSWEW